MLRLVSVHRLLLLKVRRQHHVLLEVSWWKYEIDCVLTFLLTKMLLEQLRYRVFDTLQVEQEGAIEGLLSRGVKGLVLMYQSLGVLAIKTSASINCPEIVLAASGVPQI
jgi:hypothetical protein